MHMLFRWCYITDNYYIFRRWLKVYLNFSYLRNIFYSDYAILSLWKKRFMTMDILQKKKPNFKRYNLQRSRDFYAFIKT